MKNRFIHKSSFFCKLITIDEIFSSFNVFLQFWNSFANQLFFIAVQLAKAKILLDATLSNDKRGGKIFGVRTI
jgi:hypothetical protein